MATAVVAAGYSVADRERIFGKAKEGQTGKERNKEQQKYRAAKRSQIQMSRKPKPKKK